MLDFRLEKIQNIHFVTAINNKILKGIDEISDYTSIWRHRSWSDFKQLSQGTAINNIPFKGKDETSDYNSAWQKKSQSDFKQ